MAELVDALALDPSTFNGVRVRFSLQLQTLKTPL
jgi:hypothetical protein